MSSLTLRVTIKQQIKHICANELHSVGLRSQQRGVGEASSHRHLQEEDVTEEEFAVVLGRTAWVGGCRKTVITGRLDSGSSKATTCWYFMSSAEKPRGAN